MSDKHIKEEVIIIPRPASSLRSTQVEFELRFFDILRREPKTELATCFQNDGVAKKPLLAKIVLLRFYRHIKSFQNRMHNLDT